MQVVVFCKHKLSFQNNNSNFLTLNVAQYLKFVQHDVTESYKKTYIKLEENTSSVRVIFPSVTTVYLLIRTELSVDAIFFLSGFSFTNTHESRTGGEEGGQF